MRQVIKAKIERSPSGDSTYAVIPAEDSGLILLGPTLSPVAYDRGAAEILKLSTQAGSGSAASIPDQILGAIRGRNPSDLSSLEFQFSTGPHDYVCRTFLVESRDARPSLVALHFERRPSEITITREFGQKYRLTRRELEVLAYLSKGLTNKEVAQRMDISPQTVKGFARAIMVKMGACSRGEILAKLLEHNSPVPRPMMRVAAPVRREFGVR